MLASIPWRFEQFHVNGIRESRLHLNYGRHLNHLVEHWWNALCLVARYIACTESDESCDGSPNT
jgi:hypothetical protein